MSAVLRAAVQAVLVTLGLSVHYTCQSDEVNGEIQGETGVVCGPRCSAGNYDCPLDVPQGTSAQPQCMLQDVDMGSYCGLLCQTDAQCPSGADCRRVGTPEVGLCIHSLSFSEWAKQGVRRKLAIGWPAHAGASTRGFQIAKAYAALQSLKKRYGVQDGDADVLVVKELLSAASSASFNRPPMQQGWGMVPTAGQPAQSGGGSWWSGSSQPTQPSAGSWWGSSTPATPPPSPPPPVVRAGPENPWMHDINSFTGYLKDGIPGLEREAHDIVWNLEHIDQYGKATDMLRCVILVALAYLIIGAAYKFQTMGARGIDMIPHIGFWQEYPNLVHDGVRYLQVLLGGSLPRSSNFNTGFQQMGSKDRDTFAHFEPIR